MASFYILKTPSYMDKWDAAKVNALPYKTKRYKYDVREQVGDIVEIMPYGNFKKITKNKPEYPFWMIEVMPTALTPQGLKTDCDEARKLYRGDKSRAKDAEEITRGRIEVDAGLEKDHNALILEGNISKIEAFVAKKETLRQEGYTVSDDRQVIANKFRTNVDITKLPLAVQQKLQANEVPTITKAEFTTAVSMK